MKTLSELLKKPNVQILLAFLLALLTYYVNSQLLMNFAQLISNIFVNFLKLIALPIVFFSIVATVSGIENIKDLKIVTKKTLFYTLSTTFIAALIALLIYKIIDPANNSFSSTPVDKNIVERADHGPYNYIEYFSSIIPSNFFKIFIDNNIIGCLIVAFLVAYAINKLEPEKKSLLNKVFTSLFDILLTISKVILKILPLAVWAFVSLFLNNLNNSEHALNKIFLFLLCVVTANLLQGFVVLPALLKYKGLPVIKTFKTVIPALTLAFFSKSSSATLPTTLDNVQNNLKVSKKLSSFTLPMCTTINMNACAAFIFICVSFVSELNGYKFTAIDNTIWVILAVIGAIGNAGVPMGCYFIATGYLIALKMPLEIMGVILPLYAILDMLETCLNVWSDICITQIVNSEYKMDE